jgi:hypothetical protein
MLVLVRYLRRLGISVLGYIDDFAAVCSTYDEGVQLDRFLRHTFATLGLVLNFKKSTPEPTQRACVLGIDVDLVAHTFSIPDKRKSSIVATAKSLLRLAMLGRTVSVRDLASLTGKVMSCHIVLGGVAHLFTRSLFRVIAVATGLPPEDAKNYRRLRALWRTRCRLTTAAQSETAFWLTHIADAQPEIALLLRPELVQRLRAQRLAEGRGRGPRQSKPDTSLEHAHRGYSCLSGIFRLRIHVISNKLPSLRAT